MTYKPTGGKPGRPVPPVPDDPRVKPELSERMWRAIAVEYHYYAAGLDPWPSTASLGQVAAAAGVTRPAILKKRRHDPLYRAALEWAALEWFRELLAELSEDFRQRVAERDRPSPSWWTERSREAWEKKDDASRAHLIEIWARRHWHQVPLLTGPIDSDLDPRNFADPKSYADHIIAAGYIPHQDILEEL